MTTKDRSILTFKGARILVTGHTGFKGSWLSLWLSEVGGRVVGVSSDVPSEPAHFTAAGINASVEDRRLDICDIDAICQAVNEIAPDFIFHLAAQPLVKKSYADPVRTWQVNALGTVNMLEALRSLKQPCIGIFITSDKCYDNVEWVWGYRETDRLGGPDPYSASKGAAELAIRSYIRSYFPKSGRARIGVGRAGNVIGGGDWAEDRIVPDCVRAWSRGKAAQIRNPLATRPWQHVLEPLSGYVSLALALHNDPELHGEPFNFGPPAHQNHSVGELVSAMAKHWDKVRWEDISAQNGGPHESSMLKLNCDKALARLRWHSVWDFETTVHETASWYRQYYESQGHSVADLSRRQIADYVAQACRQGLLWAQ